MNKAIIGKKLGMSQVFLADGTVIPVTIVEAGPCTVVQVKTASKEGYDAVQLGFDVVKARKLNKAELGHLKLANAQPLNSLVEVSIDNAKVGDTIKCDVFAENEFVDVTGLTKGHGFSGVIKRWNQHRLKETHGVGPVHRQVGSMGANTSPGRVIKGKNLPGQYGVEQVTILNLSVVKVDIERNVLMIKGAIPGPKGSIIAIRNAVKK